MPIMNTLSLRRRYRSLLAAYIYTHLNNCLFLCDDIQANRMLSSLLCRHITTHDSQRPVIHLEISLALNEDAIFSKISEVLHDAAIKWLGISPFDRIISTDLTLSDKAWISQEIIQKLGQNPP